MNPENDQLGARERTWKEPRIKEGKKEGEEEGTGFHFLPSGAAADSRRGRSVIFNRDFGSSCVLLSRDIA